VVTSVRLLASAIAALVDGDGRKLAGLIAVVY